MPRDLGVVINQMLEQIPLQEHQLRHDLKCCRESFEWTSPETVPLRWVRTAEALEDNLPKGEEFNQWQQRVYDIWMDNHA